MPARKRNRFSWAGLALAALSSVAMAAPPRDGVLDPAFGTDGIARFDTLAGDTIRPRVLYGIVALPDGGALMLGAGYAVDPALPLSPLLPLVLRIDRHGALVPGFGTGGAYLLPALPGIEQFGARAISALPLADGRIVVVSAVARDDFSYQHYPSTTAHGSLRSAAPAHCCRPLVPPALRGASSSWTARA